SPDMRKNSTFAAHVEEHLKKYTTPEKRNKFEPLERERVAGEEQDDKIQQERVKKLKEVFSQQDEGVKRNHFAEKYRSEYLTLLESYIYGLKSKETTEEKRWTAKFQYAAINQKDTSDQAQEFLRTFNTYISDLSQQALEAHKKASAA